MKDKLLMAGIVLVGFIVYIIGSAITANVRFFAATYNFSALFASAYWFAVFFMQLFQERRPLHG
jgi:hypothetical protein